MSGRHELSADMKDEILRDTLIAKGGEVVHPLVKETLAQKASAVGSS